MNDRFRDYTTSLDAFEQEIWVQCPRCQQAVLSRCLEPRLTWRIACGHCGNVQTACRKASQRRDWPWWKGSWWDAHRRSEGAIDPLFGLPLWFQQPCCGHVLWAYNVAHLDFLEQYVGATLRERQGTKGNHHGIAVRLPRWMKQAKHRAAILKTITELRVRLPGN